LTWNPTRSISSSKIIDILRLSIKLKGCEAIAGHDVKVLDSKHPKIVIFEYCTIYLWIARTGGPKNHFVAQ
jgi:hypothetical protein